MTVGERPELASEPPHFDAIIFDCDGVLVDSEQIAMSVSQRMLADLGWDVDIPTLLDMFTGSSSEYFVARVERQIGRALDAGWRERHRRRVAEALGSGVRAIPDLAAALDRIRMPMAVASNSGHERIRLSLEAAGLLGRFPRRSSAEDVAAGKPAPDVYEHAAASLGVSPDRCIAVDDSRFGIEAAHDAGMHVLAFRDGATSELSADGRITPLRSMRDLPGLVDRLVSTGSSRSQDGGATRRSSGRRVDVTAGRA